ncbi:MAG: hypothetical protein GF331_03950 [Chitinivibrionales bacterium]|nr:hypothetical protein [Chitinivibrionales bacterium]
MWCIERAALGFALLAAFHVAAVNVTVDHETEFQTIEGFGAHGAQNVWWSDGPFATPSFVTTVVDELGLTISRNEFYPDFEPLNENGDAFSMDFSAFNFDGQFVGKQKEWIEALKAKAGQSGEPIKFIATYWSPPFWMKTNMHHHGGSLKSIARDELAEYAIATVRAYKEICNVDLYALSMQNELAFSQPFNSCVYTPESYRDMIKVVGPRLHDVYPDIKLFGPEDMLSAWTNRAFPGLLMADTLSRRQMWAVAVHGYEDGTNPTPSSLAPKAWAKAYSNMQTVGKPLWMTETSGYSNDWDGARGVGEAIFEALKYGHVSAWVWWQLAGSHTAGEILMPRGEKGKLFYAAKQYFRYIRPGAVMIDVNADDSEVFVAGFHHKHNNTLTIVILNWSSSSKDITLSGQNLPSFTSYRTSSSDDCTNTGTVTGSVTLPANSITTLFGTGYEPPTTATALRSGSRPSVGAVRAEVFGIDGRLLRVIDRVILNADNAFAWDGRTRSGRVAAGVYCARVTDRAGRAGRASATVFGR